MRLTPRVAGFRSEYPAGFKLECMAGFVGTRNIWAWSERTATMHGIRCTAPPQSTLHGRYAITQVITLSVSIAVFGGIWAFLALGPLSGFVLVWAGFIGWGCFFHSGANTNALVKTIAGNAYGALVAWVALLIIVNVPVPGLGAVWPARRHCVLPGHRRLDRSAVRGTGQRLRLRCACGVLAAPAIRRAGHRPIAESGLALVRQPAGLAHCLDGDRSPVRLCLGPAREGAAHKTTDQGGARITEARRFVPGPNSGIDSVPRSMDNRSRRPVDFRYMASARKAPPD